MDCTHNGRDLLDRHLLLLAKAEEKGLTEVADTANEVWMLHEIAISTLESLAEGRQ